MGELHNMDPGVLEAFQKDTGNSWQPGRVREFVLWVNENVWGNIGEEVET